MKKIHPLFGIGFMALSLTTTYGCELSSSKKQTLVAQAFTADGREKPSNHTVKIALLLDTSNSMDGLINQAKAQLWDIVNKFTHAKCGTDARPRLEIALYQYGNDYLSPREGYIQQVLNFSSDLDEISEKLFSLSTNGGEEYCGEVISTSLKQLDWGKNQDHLKMIFIAGNEPFTQGKLNYKEAVIDAKEKDIIVNTIFCGNYQEGIDTEWKNGAILSGGEYMAIDHNRAAVYVTTPYDEVIIQLNAKLNGTYISYGSLGASKKALQAEQDTNAAAMEEVVVVKRAVSKSSRMYKNAEWDLVDASEKEDFDLAKIKKEALPIELKGKSMPEIQTYIEDKKSERSKIQKEIQDLNEKREAYIARHQKENAKGELENAMLEAIQKQAARKNYTWE
jgi:hypothetical protein